MRKMKFKIFDQKNEETLSEGEWDDAIPMPVRGDAFTFDGEKLMRITECLFVMQEGRVSRLTFLVLEDESISIRHDHVLPWQTTPDQ
jgi:hypothetical protein